jgi:hypothetical protein
VQIERAFAGFSPCGFLLMLQKIKITLAEAWATEIFRGSGQF